MCEPIFNSKVAHSPETWSESQVGIRPIGLFKKTAFDLSLKVIE